MRILFIPLLVPIEPHGVTRIQGYKKNKIDIFAKVQVRTCTCTFT